MLRGARSFSAKEKRRVALAIQGSALQRQRAERISAVTALSGNALALYGNGRNGGGKASRRTAEA